MLEFLTREYSTQVSIDRTADWWLGNLDDKWFHALEDAVRDEWEVEPLRIREGGVRATLQCPRTTLMLFLQSIPSVPYLEKEFECHALHLPLGQSTVSKQVSGGAYEIF